MNFTAQVEDVVLSSLEKLELAHWIEIVTDQPHCLYYFGPFANRKAAQRSLAGYIQDLEQEGAKVISCEIKKGQPEELTVMDG
ncbi:MAG TPA: hypothetical protein DD379_28030 [Cyanobacteria bacterium UBA11162]|nr:hypothetical protein [Cyanobacteria bacterium UBA11162]